MESEAKTVHSVKATGSSMQRHEGPSIVAGAPVVMASADDAAGHFLSWRLAVEANNVRAWSAVPPQFIPYVEEYMLGGQYDRDLATVVDQILTYLDGIVAAADGLDDWALDVDDTCVSNLPYFREKNFGGDPPDPVGAKNWSMKGVCPAISSMLEVYKKLIAAGFKVFLVTGRDEPFGPATAKNLFSQGFVGHERLILRGPAYKGQSAVVFKSSTRKQLVAEGYRIRGNVGDQWSYLLGDCAGDRVFKIPNPVYCMP